MSNNISAPANYFVPPPSRWPIRAGIALVLAMGGTAALLNRAFTGVYFLGIGLLFLVVVLVGWFRTVIGEDQQHEYNAQVDRSFRQGMAWFIFSEVMVFGTLFAALFYLRHISVPTLAHGESAQLWPGFTGGWPASGPGIDAPLHPMSAWGVPAINTVILLVSGGLVTLAGRGMRGNNRALLLGCLAATLLLGVTFLFMQANEYRHAIGALHLTLGDGAYGATFFMITGLHGVHVAIGATMIAVILVRSMLRQFTPMHHFAFDAVTWYWHFVGVVWLIVFVVVYWL